MPTILIVDDEELNRQLLAKLVEAMGHTPLQAADGGEAWALVRSHSPRLVVTDVLMPHVDGIELVRRMRSEPATAGIPVVVYSATFPETDAAAVLDAAGGIQRFLFKPAEVETIVEVLNRALGEAEIAPAPAAVHEDRFHDEHRRLLLSKLVEKSEELEEATVERLVTERQFRVAFENSPVGMAVTSLDGRFRKVNPALCGLLGYAEADLLTRGWPDVAEPADVGDFLQAAQLMAEGDRVSYTAEARCLRRDGRLAWVLLAVAPVTDHEGRVLHLFLQVRDITDRKRAEQELRDSEHEARGFLEHMAAFGPGVLFRADLPALNLTYVSPNVERFFGHPPGDARRPGFWLENVHPDDHSLLARALEAVIAEGGSSAEATFRFRHRLGHWMCVRTGLAVERDGHGAPVAVLGYAEDVSEQRRQQEALVAAQELHRRVVETASEGICLLDHRGVTTFVNARLAEMLGWPPDEMVGRRAVDFVARQDRAEAIRLGRGQPGPREAELRLRRRDGSEIVALVHAGPLLLDAATPHGLVLMLTDITARKEAEAALVDARRQAEAATAQLTGVLQAATEHSVIATDVHGVITLFNVGAERLLGYRAEEVVGRCTPALFHDGEEVAARAAELGLPAGLRVFVQAALAGGAETREWTYVRKDATGVPVSLSVSATHSESGEITGYVAMATDISGRKVAEAALEERARLSDFAAAVGMAVSGGDELAGMLEQVCQATVEHLDAAVARIWILDEAGETLDLVASAGASTSVEGAGAREPLGVPPIGHIAAVRAPMIIASAGDPSWARCAGVGTERIEALAGLPLVLDDRLVGVVGVFTTGLVTPTTQAALAAVTDQIAVGIERKRAEEAAHRAREEADRANLAKSDFLSRMSHELRTPLNAILGFAQLLELDDHTPQQAESVEHIVKGGTHLLELINEILEISRIEAGTMTISLEPVFVPSLARDVVDLLTPMAAKRGILLALPDVGGPWVVADQQRLKQVLLNLVSNAIKYNRDGGRVNVSCRTGEGAVRVTVSDTGAGLTPDQVGKLFTPFERLGADQRGIEGTGIGLALTRGLLERMGGVIGVDSIPGQGSDFWFELPPGSPAVDLVAMEEEPLPGVAPAGRAGTLLYVEDNLANLQLVERIMERRPEVRLLVAMQGALGVDLAREHRPDLIALDVHLPDIGGLEVLSRLKAEPCTRDIPVVVVSADATTRQIERMLDGGASGYMTKPLNVRQFLAHLDAALTGAPAS